MALLDNLETMLRHGQDNALVRYGLGNEYLKSQQYGQAIVHLQKALAFDPGYSAAWKLLGKAYTGAAQSDEAIAAYESGIRAAEAKGDVQAAKEMRVFLKRLKR
jgi:Tfp pilus assembly protein PilF